MKLLIRLIAFLGVIFTIVISGNLILVNYNANADQKIYKIQGNRLKELSAFDNSPVELFDWYVKPYNNGKGVGFEKAWKRVDPTTSNDVVIADFGPELNLHHEDLEGSNITFACDYTLRNVDAPKCTNSKADSFLSVRNDHGMMTTGIMNAMHNGQIGINGAAYNTKEIYFTIEGASSSDKFNYLHTSSVVNALKDIRDGKYGHIDFINFSLGDDEPNTEIKTIIDDLYGQDTILIASAGNYGEDGFGPSGNPTIYPAAYDNVVSVGATSPLKLDKGVRRWWEIADTTNTFPDPTTSNVIYPTKVLSVGYAPFTSYGKVDISAPGDHVLTTAFHPSTNEVDAVCRYTNQFFHQNPFENSWCIQSSVFDYGLYMDYDFGDSPHTWNQNQYAIAEGTSFASPLVVSAAALLKRVHKELTNKQVIEILKQTANDVDKTDVLAVMRSGRTESYIPNPTETDPTESRLITQVFYYLDKLPSQCIPTTGFDKCSGAGQVDIEKAIKYADELVR